MERIIIIDRDDMDFPVTLIQYADGDYGVIYGEQVTKCLTYDKAAFELGACLMHSLTCAGNLD